jgi:hypothetical protein
MDAQQDRNSAVEVMAGLTTPEKKPSTDDYEVDIWEAGPTDGLTRARVRAQREG